MCVTPVKNNNIAKRQLRTTMTFHLAQISNTFGFQKRIITSHRAYLMSPLSSPHVCSKLAEAYALLLNNAAASGCSARTLDAASYSDAKPFRVEALLRRTAHREECIHWGRREREGRRNIWRTVFCRMCLSLYFPFTPFFRAALRSLRTARRRTLT